LETKIIVGIIDDNPTLSEGLRLFMEDKGFSCQFAVNSKLQFQAEIENQAVDVVLADVIMPDVVGLELFEWLAEKYPATPVIVYSNIRNIQLINELFRFESVHALVSKNEPLLVLPDAIRQVVLEKKKIFPDEYAHLSPQAISLKLTEREIQVLKLMAKGESSKAIGEQLGISENTILFHKKKLFQLFNTSNIYHLIVEAKECGFLN